MEEQNSGLSSEQQYHITSMMSPEIVEIGEEESNKSGTSSNDVYVAVGKEDLDVLKWVLDHLVLPETRVFLIHVFPPINHIPTPVGRLSRSQVSKEQVKTYIMEESNKRKNLLHKYIRLCTDAKVEVDTILIESSLMAKAILDLIPILNINTLVMGTKRAPSSRRQKGTTKCELVRKSSPDFCEVIIVFDGKKVEEGQQVDICKCVTTGNPKTKASLSIVDGAGLPLWPADVAPKEQDPSSQLTLRKDFSNTWSEVRRTWVECVKQSLK